MTTLRRRVLELLRKSLALGFAGDIEGARRARNGAAFYRRVLNEYRARITL